MSVDGSPFDYFRRRDGQGGNNSVFRSWACRGAAENRKYIGLPFYQHAAPMELGESPARLLRSRASCLSFLEPFEEQSPFGLEFCQGERFSKIFSRSLTVVKLRFELAEHRVKKVVRFEVLSLLNGCQ